MWNNHMIKALPCRNTQQTAEKTISKVQQTLSHGIIVVLNKIGDL
jgi:hypothetical protein